MEDLKLVVFRPESMQAMDDHLASVGYIKVFSGCWILRDERIPIDIAIDLKELVDDPNGAVLVLSINQKGIALLGNGNIQGMKEVMFI